MNKIIYRLDWVTILLYVALVIFGISNIYSTNYNENSNLINLKTPVGKQVAFAVASFIVAIVMLTIKAKVFERFASVFYLLTLILLIGLFAFGSNISGATSLFSFGGVGLLTSD